MKMFLFISFIMIALSCNQQDNKVEQLQAQIDSLQIKLNNSYKPGFGEFMSAIQIHHAKLWFAGINSNWDLADFEVNEIKESLEDISTYCIDRIEAKSIGMINAPIDSVSNAIKLKNVQSFKSSFNLLTNTCNNCHKTTAHAFNVVTIPSGLPVPNQDFQITR